MTKRGWAMNEITVMIVDDEPLAHDVIIPFLSKFPHFKLVAQCYSAREANQMLKDCNVDVLFLDINMPQLSGLDFLQQLTSQPVTIITSAYRQYALQSFDLDVCDYLLKPFSERRFLQAIQKAEKALVPNGATVHPLQESIFVKVDQKRHKIILQDICFVEAFGNYIKIHLQNNVLLTTKTLSAVEDELQLINDNFLRVHKSFLVNKAHVKIVSANEVELSFGHIVPIGKTFRRDVKPLLLTQN